MKYLLLIFFACSTFFAQADIIAVGEVQKEFRFINLNQFSNYKFSYKIQTYRYDKGYQPNGIITTQIKNDTAYATSRDGKAVNIIATDNSGNTYLSNIQVGGMGKFNRNVVSVVEVFKVIGIKNGILKIKKVKEIITTNRNGKNVIKEKKAGILSVVNDPLIFGLLVAGIASGLLLFFVKQRKNAAVN